jgi:heme/copper-type cytochrome/quinol oxidase subunit 1
VLMALTVLGFIGLLVTSIMSQDRSAEADPYDGQTLEWATASPAPANNFVDAPTVMSAEPLADSNSNYGQTDSEKGDS